MNRPIESIDPLAELPHERLSRVLSRAGLTNEDVAEALGVDPTTVSRWRTKHLPNRENMRRVVRLIRSRGIPVTAEWIETGDDSDIPPRALARPTD